MRADGALPARARRTTQTRTHTHTACPAPTRAAPIAGLGGSRALPSTRSQWDLDVIDALEPTAVLGVEGAQAMMDRGDSAAAEALAASGKRPKEGGGKKKKKRKEGGGGGPEGHTDAVMSLSWNPLQRNVLASGSADHSVRLWDIEGDGLGSTAAFTHHTDKVQALQWHPLEPPILLSAGFDRRAAAIDVRAPDAAARHFTISADAEKVCWAPGGTSFVVSSEDGVVKSFDVRKGGSELWSMQAHPAAVTGLDFCPAAADILATGSQDKLVKLWSVGGSEPAMVGKRNLQLGGIFDVRFSADSPQLLAAGGAKGKMGIWNTLELEAMQERMPAAQAALDEDGRVRHA